MWKVGDVACGLVAGEGDYYRLVRITAFASRVHCVSLLNNKTVVFYEEHELKRVVASFVGPVALEHEGPTPARFAWLT